MPFSLRESIASRIRRVARGRYRRSAKGRARAWALVVRYHQEYLPMLKRAAGRKKRRKGISRAGRHPWLRDRIMRAQ